jgi:hypothetical protein
MVTTTTFKNMLIMLLLVVSVTTHLPIFCSEKELIDKETRFVFYKKLAITKIISTTESVVALVKAKPELVCWVALLVLLNVRFLHLEKIIEFQGEETREWQYEVMKNVLANYEKM